MFKFSKKIYILVIIFISACTNEMIWSKKNTNARKVTGDMLQCKAWAQEEAEKFYKINEESYYYRPNEKSSEYRKMILIFESQSQALKLTDYCMQRQGYKKEKLQQTN